MLNLFGSPRKLTKDLKQNPVPTLDGIHPYNPYTQIRVLSQHHDIIRHLVVVHPNRVASAGDDTVIFIWDLQTGEYVHMLTEHSRPITCLSVLPLGGATDGDVSSPVLLSAASDKIICMWEPVSGRLLRQMRDHQSTARCFLFVPGSSCFCSGGEKLCLWTPEGDLITSLDRKNEEDVSQLIELRNARLVLSVDKRPIVYNIREVNGATNLVLNRILTSHREAITCLLKINDACFVTGSLDGTIVLWSAQALAPSRYFNSISDYLGDNRVLPYSIQATICLEERYLVCAIGTGFCIYDIIPGCLVAQRRHAHYSKILSIAVIHKGTLLATTSEDGFVRFWGCMKNFTQHADIHVQSDVSALQKLLGIGTKDVKLLKEKGEKIEPQLLGECQGHNGAARVCVDVGDQGILTCGADGLLINWQDGLYESMKMNSLLHDFYNNASIPSFT